MTAKSKTKTKTKNAHLRQGACERVCVHVHPVAVNPVSRQARVAAHVLVVRRCCTCGDLDQIWGFDAFPEQNQ